jgi:hypothetical protein
MVSAEGNMRALYVSGPLALGEQVLVNLLLLFFSSMALGFEGLALARQTLLPLYQCFSYF